MKPWQLFRKAVEFGILPESACVMRGRFLRERIARYEEWWDEFGDPLDLHFQRKDWDEYKALERAMEDRRAKKPGMKEKPITDEEIERAREYPIDSLVDFDRNGKTYAPCHNDKNPSLTWWKSANRAKCWPCNKSWNPIEWVMEFEAKTFTEAVKTLVGR